MPQSASKFTKTDINIPATIMNMSATTNIRL